MMTCSIPAATASSTPYWMIGLSTSGSISLGCALVAGRNRVPHPAAGKTAFRTRIEPVVAVELVGPASIRAGLFAARSGGLATLRRWRAVTDSRSRARRR